MIETIEVVLVGDRGVGKSALLLRFLNDTFAEEYDPTIEDIYVKHVEYATKLYRLRLTDTGSNDVCVSEDEHVDTADGVLIVFATNDFKTYENAITLMEKIHWCKGVKRNVPTVFVANKDDLQLCDELVGRLRAGILTNKYGVPCVAASAKTGVGVKEAFSALVKEILLNRRVREEHEKNIRLAGRSTAPRCFPTPRCTLQ